MNRYFLGVDGGGSKTLALIVDESMRTLGEGRGGPSNHLRVGVEVARGEVERAVTAAVGATGISTLDIEYAYLGLAGSDHPKHRKTMASALTTLFPYRNFTIDSDARIALTAGVGMGPGIVVIAGTGSVAYGRDHTGREARAGGWGPTLGDEGSGYAIGRRGLAAVVRAYDGRGPATIITELVCQKYDLCDPKDLPYFVYAPTTHADDIALHCRIVIDAAREGDEVALEILAEEGAELATTIIAVAHELEMKSDVSIAYVGGVFNAGELLIAPIRRAVQRELPGSDLHPPIEAPAEGAARMAILAADAARDTRRRTPPKASRTGT